MQFYEKKKRYTEKGYRKKQSLQDSIKTLLLINLISPSECQRKRRSATISNIRISNIIIFNFLRKIQENDYVGHRHFLFVIPYLLAFQTQYCQFFRIQIVLNLERRKNTHCFSIVCRDNLTDDMLSWVKNEFSSDLRILILF